MKVTYLQLLKMVAEGKQPQKIKYLGTLYKWDGCEYRSANDGANLSKQLINWTSKAQTTAEFIEFVKEILTEKEKEYLSAVIKPFKEDVMEIAKFEYQYQEVYEYIRIVLKYDSINFPIFAKGKMYKGMEKAKKYTLEELDL